MKKNIFFSILCITFLACKISLASPPQQADMNLKYDVYAGGFKALHAQFDMNVDPQAYDIKITAYTQGIIGSLFPWQGDYRTAGHADRKHLVPSQYTAKSIWKKKEKVTELNYGPRGEVLKMTSRDGDKISTSRDINKELSQDSVDLLTGTLLMIQSAKVSDKCDGEIPVFDGKRRYLLVLQGNEIDTIRKSDYSAYYGPALKCTLIVKPVAGFKPKDQKRGWMAVQNHTLERKKPPTIWFASPTPGAPVVPVRMEINSDYGAAVAHLTAGEINNHKIIASK